MTVHAVADTSARLAALRAILEPHFAVTCELLGGPTVQRSRIDALVVKADLRALENISALKKLLDSCSKVSRRIFLVDDAAHLYVAQAYALGASRVLPGPVERATLLAELTDRAANGASSVAEDARSTEAAAAMGEATLASMFTAVATGMPVDAQCAKSTGRLIAESIAEHGLSDWLTAVRRHHEGTYQHCLLVTGVAVDFGLSLGVPNADIERLSSAAMFHDIGKAKVPLAVLDKPGRLDPEERALIETHPVAGYDVLKGTNGISLEILQAVRNHHEYLDGSGYPDGLCAQNIPDIVRLLTISDVFAALIEDRRYKPPMPRAQAYDILCGMHGKLEKALLTAFGEVALHR
jgi:putative nucleotidyltransferase with HDIG domain